MKKNTIFALLILPFSAIVTAQVHSHLYLDAPKISFLPEQKHIEKLSNEVDVQVRPVSIDELNELTFKHIQPEVAYATLLSTEIERQRRTLSPNNNLIRAVEVLNKYVKDGKMNEKTAFAYKMRIWKGLDWGFDGKENEIMLGKTIYPDTYNPFKLNTQSLTVLKLVFENKGKEVERIKLDAWQLSVGNEILYPLKKAFFENQIFGLAEKMLNYQRLAMPEDLILMPNQRVEKYIVFPNINLNSTVWQLQYIKEKHITNIEFDVKQGNESQYIYLRNYGFEIKGLQLKEHYNIVYALAFDDGLTFALDNAQVFLTEERLKIPATIYALAINRVEAGISICKLDNVIFNDLDKNVIRLDFSANKISHN